jgi:EcsC protein family
MTTDYQIVHDIPGRVRLRVPRLRHDENYTLTVQGLLEEIEPVIDTRAVPVNETLVVRYEPRAIEEKHFREKLNDILALARDHDPDRAFTTRFPGYRARALTLYELGRAREIRDWWLDFPDGLTTTVAQLSAPLVKILDWLTPEWVAEKTLRSLDHLARTVPDKLARWHSENGVTHPIDPRDVTLEESDRLAERVRKETLEISVIEGTIAGLLGPVGELANVPAFVFQALESIHRIGSCYGYPPSAEAERNFAYTILGAGLAATPGEKRRALQNLRESHERFYRQTFDDTVSEFGSKTTVGTVRDTLLGQALAYLAPSAAGAPLLLLFAVFFDVNKDSSLDRSVVDSARHAYRARWLMDNGKLEPVNEEVEPMY